MRAQFFGKILRPVIHVDPNSADRDMRCILLRAHFHKHACDLFSSDANVVWRLDRHSESELFGNRLRDRFGRPSDQSSRITDVDLGPQQDREPKSLVSGGLPEVAALAAPGGLTFGKYDHTFRRV